MKKKKKDWEYILMDLDYYASEVVNSIEGYMRTVVENELDLDPDIEEVYRALVHLTESLKWYMDEINMLVNDKTTKSDDEEEIEE